MNIIKLNATDSTNSYLRLLARESYVADETVVIADNQTKGRGQRGNSWFSKSGESLTFSVLKQFSDLPAERQFLIAMAVSIAICDALSVLKVSGITIKWPNDILSDGKKIGAILIENTLEKQNIKYSVIGVGINVNLERLDNLPQASSMKILTGKHFDLEKVFHAILDRCFGELRGLRDEQYALYKKRYENYLFNYEAESLFEAQDGSCFHGIIVGISDRGELLLQTDHGPVTQVKIKQLKMIY